MYQLLTYKDSTVILRLADNASIPCDPLNTDYIAYLEWCKTNTPLPAEEQA